MDEDTHVHSDSESQSHDEEPNKSNAMLWVGVCVIALLLVGGIVMSRKASPQPQQNTTNVGVEENVDTTTDTSLENSGEVMDDTTQVDEVQLEQTEGDLPMESSPISVEGGMFYFKPNEIRVKVGQPVKVVFNNVEGMHDFVIDELNVKAPVVKAGESAEVEFTPAEAGEYEFYCSVGNHRQQGMKGTLIVEE